MKWFIHILGLILSSFVIIACFHSGGGGDTQTFTLTITMDGSGGGRVTSSPDGISCDTDCSESYTNNTEATLTAVPYSGSIFTGWNGGGCSGTGTCTLTMNTDTSVTATFAPGASDTVNLITPYANESDMSEIGVGFGSGKASSVWGYVHDGFDIFPNANLKPFQAACSGRVKRIYAFSDMVSVFIECNPTYTIEYTFEPQAADTGQTQLDNIAVIEGQAVSQGDIIGHLYSAESVNAHVHFTFEKNWIPTCPDPYFSTEAGNSMLNLIRAAVSGANMCYGGDVTPTPLVTPYLLETDMTEIQPGFSSDNSVSPWDFVNDGLDIYPTGDLKTFQASCSGVVDSIELRQAGADSNWQVDVLVQCNEYVTDPDNGGYFIPFSINYVFEPMSNIQADGQTQLGNIAVVEGQAVSQGDIIGFLNVISDESHMHFGLVQFGSSDFSALGMTGIPLCPEPHFSTDGKNSILNLLRVAWPSANMCYQD